MELYILIKRVPGSLRSTRRVVWLGYALVLQPRHSTTLRYELRGATIALRRSFLTLALSCLASSPLRAGLPLAVEAAGLKVTKASSRNHSDIWIVKNSTPILHHSYRLDEH